MTPPGASSPPWDRLGSALARRYARSYGRLARDLALLLTLLVPLYLLRGPRLVLLTAAGVAAAIAAGAAFARPAAALGGILFLAFSGLDVVVPGPVLYALAAVLVARMVYDALDGHRIDWGSTGHRGAAAVLFAACLTSLLAARDFTAAGAVTQQIVTGALLYAGIARYAATQADVRRFLLVAVAGLAASVALEFRSVLSIGGLAMVAVGQTRFMTLGTADPNVSAAQLDCLLPFGFYLAAWMPRRWRGAMWALVALLITGLILSSSRGGMAVMGLLIPACLLFERRLHRHAMWLLLAVVVTLLVMPAAYWQRFADIGQFSGIVVDRSLQLREHALRSSWNMFVQHPWFGVGLGNVPSEMPRYMMMRLMAHNTWLEVAASLGAAGIAAYAVWWYTGVRMAWQARARAQAAGQDETAAIAFATAAALVAFGVVGMTLSIPFYAMLWLPLALATVVRRLSA